MTHKAEAARCLAAAAILRDYLASLDESSDPDSFDSASDPDSD